MTLFVSNVCRNVSPILWRGIVSSEVSILCLNNVNKFKKVIRSFDNSKSTSKNNWTKIVQRKCRSTHKRCDVTPYLVDELQWKEANADTAFGYLYLCK